MSTSSVAAVLSTTRRTTAYWRWSGAVRIAAPRVLLCQQQQPQQPQSQRRSLATSRTVPTYSSSSNNNDSLRAALDRRLAGRKRFYRRVDIGRIEDPQQLPWNKNTSSSTSSAHEAVVSSGIAAGVDGTDSASGVQRRSTTTTTTSQSQWADLLQPRRVVWRPSDLVDNDNNNNTSTNLTTDWYGVTLDGRFLQTPLGHKLVVPSALWAAQIAAEWNAVADVLVPAQMPAMTLTCTILDQVGTAADSYRQQVLRYSPTDTTCYWTDPTCSDEDPMLYQQQHVAWNGVHQRVTEITNQSLATVSGTSEGVLTGRRGLPHPPQLVEYAHQFVHALDAWHLAALHSITVEAKSFWLAWAVLTQRVYQHDQQLQQQQQQQQQQQGSSSDDDNNGVDLLFPNVAELVQAARVEEEYQIGLWGLVEGGHDYDRLNASVNLTSALLLTECLAADCPDLL